MRPLQEFDNCVTVIVHTSWFRVRWSGNNLKLLQHRRWNEVEREITPFAPYAEARQNVNIKRSRFKTRDTDDPVSSIEFMLLFLADSLVERVYIGSDKCAILNAKSASLTMWAYTQMEVDKSKREKLEFSLGCKLCECEALYIRKTDKLWSY